MKTGVAYLAVAGTAIVWSAVAAQLVTRVGVKPVLVVGMAALTAGLLYFTQVSVDGSYVGDLLPGFLLVGVGHRLLLRADLDRGAGRREAGRGRAGVGPDQHLAADRRRARHRGALDDRDLADRGRGRSAARPCPQALVDGFSSAFMVGAVFAAVGLVAALTLIRRDELEAEVVPGRWRSSRCSTRPDGREHHTKGRSSGTGPSTSVLPRSSGGADAFARTRAAYTPALGFGVRAKVSRSTSCSPSWWP